MEGGLPFNGRRSCRSNGAARSFIRYFLTYEFPKYIATPTCIMELLVVY